jgi:hypothetical protein
VSRTTYRYCLEFFYYATLETIFVLSLHCPRRSDSLHDGLTQRLQKAFTCVMDEDRERWLRRLGGGPTSSHVELPREGSPSEDDGGIGRLSQDLLALHAKISKSSMAPETKPTTKRHSPIVLERTESPSMRDAALVDLLHQLESRLTSEQRGPSEAFVWERRFQETDHRVDSLERRFAALALDVPSVGREGVWRW